MAGVLENTRCGPLFLDESDRDCEHGVIQSVSKFLVVAANMAGTQMFELVRVGVDKLVGEVVRLDGDRVTIQLYENTTGLQVGDPVVRTRTPLSVELEPGLLGNMYDGLQRPFEEMGGKIYLEKGSNTPALDKSKLWEFVPQNFKIGDHITGGDIFGIVHETALVVHRIMLPPKAMGTITYIAPPGHYTVTEEVLVVEFMGTQKTFTMMHKWPVRQPRPYDDKMTCDTPLYTGLRVYDAMFPMAIGGTCAIPGAYGCGKGMTCYVISKYSNSDIVVYTACGERGNELSEMLLEFPEITTTVAGLEQNVMKRMCIVGNTSNMPMAAREASIYTGITTAEYFRDQGYNATMITDGTSRWAEALNEVARTAADPQIPASSGYPVYLNSRLASFYERAGKVSCLGTPARTGAVSIVAAVSPPGGDFNDPVVAATLSICDVFWGLDKKLAQRRHFPSVNYLLSYSKYIPTLTPFFENLDPEFPSQIKKIKEILQMEEDLAELVPIVGKNNLKDIEKLNLEVALLIRESFLQQNAFSRYDRCCPLYKTAWMAKNITTFYSQARQALEQNYANFTEIKSSTRDLINSLHHMKFQDPHSGQGPVEQHMRNVNNTIFEVFSTLN
eukprot:Phypoly_transcript_04929.p1 GENE.Phypoly_transcript_04929~~Phypoly_transcript_04929.p1  ORF type:complete len:615 (+),score=87.89 Phypoly_transcript_04929:114-1958(+)